MGDQYVSSSKVEDEKRECVLPESSNEDEKFALDQKSARGAIRFGIASDSFGVISWEFVDRIARKIAIHETFVVRVRVIRGSLCPENNDPRNHTK
jgi:hypothetical protein